MKKRIILVFSLVFILALVFAMSANAACEEHKDGWVVTTGENGYLGKITAVNICSECSTPTETKIINPLFETLGYSYSEMGGITQHYAVNREAVALYEQYTGEAVRFGGIIATSNNLSGNPFDADGNVVNPKVNAIDFTDTKYDVFDIIVNGIPESYRKTVGIVCCAYVMVGTEITYIDNGVEKINSQANTFEEVTQKVDNAVTELPSVNCYKYISGTKYKVLSIEDMGLVKYAYYNSDSNDKIVTYDTGGTYLKYFATKKFSKDELPYGTILNIESGYLYRPEGWKDGKKVGTRPVTSSLSIVIDEKWWGSYDTRAFNISYKTPSKFADTVTLEDIAGVFQLYVPVHENSTNTFIPPVGEPEIPFDPAEDKTKQNWDEDGALKILCIGNSFSVDSMEYVYQVAKAAGVEKIVLGNLYIGGCSLSTHLSNATNDSSSYTYYYNTDGSWKTTGGYKISTAVKSDDWDFISIQQVSGNSGVASSYDILNNILDIVEPLNPSARLVWHMTWAYQQNSSHGDFSKYGKDQMTMYNAILNAVQTKIATNDRIEFIVPAGTAIQNARTSYVGDTLTRDGYHLSDDLGRFIGSLTFVKALTGLSIDNITYAPNGVDETELLMAKESVNNAVATPFAITNSTYTTSPVEPDPEQPETPVEPDPNDPLAGLVRVEYLDLIGGSYWNSSDSTQYYFRITDADNSPYFWSTRQFTKEQLPVGSVIVISSGWQYRPDGWVDKNVATSSRPGNVSTEIVVVDDAWWGNLTVRVFNISNVNSTTIDGLTEADINAIFQIYVPESAADLNKKPEGGDVVEPETPVENLVSSDLCVDEITIINGVEYRALTMEALGLLAKEYYFSEKSTEIYTDNATMARRYFATTKFDKDILVNGAVIWVADGWLYRPEGWVGSKLNNSSTRPKEISTTYTTIDDAWWGNFTTRAFNIAMQPPAGKTDKPFLDEKGYTTAEQIYEMFKIYIPVDKIAD